ncbi:MAG: hypothetical protein P9X24_08440 [Candidatus Hatepunaea meridiana]|nr:hypothetical protein [Candidatus Hatepunaea meridiana]
MNLTPIDSIQYQTIISRLVLNNTEKVVLDINTNSSAVRKPGFLTEVEDIKKQTSTENSGWFRQWGIPCLITIGAGATIYALYSVRGN